MANMVCVPVYSFKTALCDINILTMSEVTVAGP